jgi:hypothetical protein
MKDRIIAIYLTEILSRPNFFPRKIQKTELDDFVIITETPRVFYAIHKKPSHPINVWDFERKGIDLKLPSSTNQLIYNLTKNAWRNDDK